MAGVLVREDEPFEKALRRFKKTCETAGIMTEMKKHQHFEKPSERRKASCLRNLPSPRTASLMNVLPLSGRCSPPQPSWPSASTRWKR